MSVVAYTPLQLERLSIVQLERIAIELGLVGLEGREMLTSRILEWQSGKSHRFMREFSVGMMTAPALESYALLLDFYTVKKSIAGTLNELSPLALEGVIQKLKVLPALPTAPHSLRVAYLLMQDKLTLNKAKNDGPIAKAIRDLHRYFERKDEIILYLLTLNDATLFAVVDQFGSELVVSQPYVQINGVSYDDRLAVVYYLVTLQVR